MNRTWLGIFALMMSFLPVEGRERLPDTPPDDRKNGDVKIGAGPAAQIGDTVFVHYTGTFKDGKKFDSSLDHPGQTPFTFRIGNGTVIKGFDKGVIGMKVGGVRRLVIPPELAYGAKGAPPTIPPNAELHFEITLQKIE